MSISNSSPPAFLNAHIHLPPNYSAFSSVAQAVTLAAEQGITVLGASNYYDWSVYTELAAQAEQHGIFPLFGLEIICLVPELQAAGTKINDPGNPGKFYLCGKGITQFSPLSPEAEALLSVIRTNDSQRMAAMVSKLASLLGVSQTADDIRQAIAERHACPLETVFLQERHVAQAFESETMDKNAIRSQLMKAGKPGYVPETFVDFDHAYQLILALGGIPTYPTLADGANPICPFEELESLIPELQRRKIFAAEVIPTRNSPEVLHRYVTTLRAAGIIVTAGTEHNTPELAPLVPTCLGGTPLSEELSAIFWEGAQVIVAHQSRGVAGEPGYILADGSLCPGFATSDERIAAFAAQGAQILADYSRH
jgi:hypothetical protein